MTEAIANLKKFNKKLSKERDRSLLLELTAIVDEHGAPSNGRSDAADSTTLGTELFPPLPSAQITTTNDCALPLASGKGLGIRGLDLSGEPTTVMQATNVHQECGPVYELGLTLRALNLAMTPGPALVDTDDDDQVPTGSGTVTSEIESDLLAECMQSAPNGKEDWLLAGATLTDDKAGTLSASIAEGAEPAGGLAATPGDAQPV